MSSTRLQGLLARVTSVLLLLFLALGCSLQGAPATPQAGGVPSEAAAAPPSLAATELPTAPTSLPDEALPDQTEPSAWTIGLLDEPGTLLPFSPDGRAAAPIVQAIFPAPVLEQSYAYTTTGVLTTLPTLENGDVESQSISGFLDASGQFTVTETSQPTTTQQLSITYRWSADLHWADGTPLTAADSVFSYQLFSQVQTSQEAQVAAAPIERYEQIDEHTTRAVLKPGRIEPSYLLSAWPPLPAHRLQDLPPEEALAEFKQQPLGYGPFTFGEQRPDEQIVLTRNEYWPGKDALPEQLVFRFFASADELRGAVTGGEADIGWLERIPEDLFRYLDQDQQSGAARVSYLAGPVYEHLDLNLGDDRLQDVRVRQALAYALNRPAMIDELFGGKIQPLASWILPEQRAFYAGDEQLTRYSYAPDKARALLDEAGLSDTDGDGLRETTGGQALTLSLLTTDTPLRTAIAERISADLQAVGITVEREVQPIDQFYSPTGPLYRRTFQLALFAWIASADPNGLPLWSCNAVPMQENGYTGNNFSGWCFEAAEWPLRRAASTLDTRARARDYLKHQQLWTQEAPVIPLFQRPLAAMISPQMQGVAPDPLAPITWNVTQWHRDQ
jgi:peptide/nickel transport system substrate-binding protein